MPYKNIHWIKLETRILNDPKFFMMSHDSRLLYVEILILCGTLGNKIPKNLEILSQLLRMNCDKFRLKELLDEVRANFPKLMENNDFYFIKGFKEMHNWVSRGKSQGNAKDAVDKIREDKIKIRKEQIDTVVSEYVVSKGYDTSSFNHSDWCRHQKAARDLLLKAGGDTQTAIMAINWMVGKDYEWTLETVCKKYEDFAKTKKKLQDIKEMEEVYKRTVQCTH